MQIDSLPEGLDEIARRITQLEIEREAIRREDDEVKLEEREQGDRHAARRRSWRQG